MGEIKQAVSSDYLTVLGH